MFMMINDKEKRVYVERILISRSIHSEVSFTKFTYLCTIAIVGENICEMGRQ